jgi:hypothetical protein
MPTETASIHRKFYVVPAYILLWNNRQTKYEKHKCELHIFKEPFDIVIKKSMNRRTRDTLPENLLRRFYDILIRAKARSIL